MGRLVKAIFGRQGGLIRGLLEQHFAFDAEQLRGIPPVPVRALAVGRHRIVQGNESLVEPPCPGKRQRESALELLIRYVPPGSVARLEGIAQHQQALRELATFDQQLPFQEVTRGLPERRVQTCGRLDQARDLPIGGCEVTCHRRDAADALIQYPAKQEWVILTLQLFQAEASFIERLVRETLHPKRPSQHRPGHRMVIRIVIDRVSAIPRRGGKSKNAFQILLGLARPASQEKCDAHLLIGETEVYRVANTMSDLLDPFRRDLRPTVFPAKGVNG